MHSTKLSVLSFHYLFFMYALPVIKLKGGIENGSLIVSLCGLHRAEMDRALHGIGFNLLGKYETK